VPDENAGPTNGGLQTQIESFQKQVDALIQRGRELQKHLAEDPSSIAAIASIRLWQEHCGVAINQLSGGSKAHWLARAFSEAFLLRGASGTAAEGAATEKIVERLIGVLEQAKASLSRQDNPPMVTSTMEPTPRRFDFVHNTELRPVLEQAYAESRSALDAGEYDAAMRTSCGILEALVTDALEHKGLSALSGLGAPSGKIGDWQFETRLAIAEKAGLIRGGWVRLTEAARRYREENGATIQETDARRAGQVLNVIMRDLNPGR
jgi:hypothetical protein